MSTSQMRQKPKGIYLNIQHFHRYNSNFNFKSLRNQAPT